MQTLLKKSALIGAAIAAGVALAPNAASAAPLAGASRTCPTANVCAVTASGFPGGTISVDADVTGSGTGTWNLFGPNGFKCSASFPASGGVRSWTCAGAPAGSYNATVTPNVPAQTLAIGIRW